MDVTFEVLVQLKLNAKDKKTKGKLKSCSLALNTSNLLKKTDYITEKGLTEIGSKTVTTILVQGISAHIHAEHQLGRRNDAEHLRSVIKMLEEAFMMHVEVSTNEVLTDLEKE